MVTGWRRAFCTSTPQDNESLIEEQEDQATPSPINCGKIGFSSNPSTPRLQSQPSDHTPTLKCKTTTKSPRPMMGSNQSPPKSPLKFSIFKNSLRQSRNSCGVCMQSVKSGQGTAIYTAECAHTFHFPCIAAQVSKNGSLACPLCSATENGDDPKPKRYDDDESLLSPTAGVRFNPIPEADENGEDDKIDDEEEFQGFFPNSNSPSKMEHSRRFVEVSVLPESAVISICRSYQTCAVALRVKSPPAVVALHHSRCAPVDVVTVLDISGGMSGAKLYMLKRAMRLLISSLGSYDRLSIITSSAQPKRVLPLTRMTEQGQHSARHIIDRLACSQGTCLGLATSKAIKVLEDRRQMNPIACVMVLSDSQNKECRNTNVHVSCTGFVHVDIPIHTSSFGEKLGSIHHDPSTDAFVKSIGELLSLATQDLRINLGFESGSAPGEISAVYLCNGRPTVLGSGTIRLGDLYAEEERELLVELRVPTPTVGSHHLLSVRCSYKNPTNNYEVIYVPDQALVIPRPQTVRSSSHKIERLRTFFITTRAVAESRRLVEQNDMSSARTLLSSARALLMQSRSGSAEGYVRGLEAELSDLDKRLQRQATRQRREKECEGANRDENGEPLTPTSAWKAAERLAKVAAMRKSMNRVLDLHGFENAGF